MSFPGSALTVEGMRHPCVSGEQRDRRPRGRTSPAPSGELGCRVGHPGLVFGCDISAPDGRVLHVYDTGETAGDGVVFWQHGAGMSGLPPPPLVDRARALGLRILGHDRPGYESSTP